MERSCRCPLSCGRHEGVRLSCYWTWLRYFCLPGPSILRPHQNGGRNNSRILFVVFRQLCYANASVDVLVSTGGVALALPYLHGTFSYILIGVSWLGTDRRALHLTTPRQATPSLLDLSSIFPSPFFPSHQVKAKEKVPCSHSMILLDAYRYDTPTIAPSAPLARCVRRASATISADAKGVGGLVLRDQATVRSRASEAAAHHATNGEGARLQGDVRLTSLHATYLESFAVLAAWRSAPGRTDGLISVSFVYLGSRCTKNVSPSGVSRRTPDARLQLCKL
jgi:hypothetical protein